MMNMTSPAGALPWMVCPTVPDFPGMRHFPALEGQTFVNNGEQSGGGPSSLLTQLTVQIPDVLRNSLWAKRPFRYPAEVSADHWPQIRTEIHEAQAGLEVTLTFYEKLSQDFRYHAASDFGRQIDRAKSSLNIYWHRAFVANQLGLGMTVLLDPTRANGEPLEPGQINDLTRRIVTRDSHPPYRLLEAMRRSRSQFQKTSEGLIAEAKTHFFSVPNETDESLFAVATELAESLREFAKYQRTYAWMLRRWVENW